MDRPRAADDVVAALQAHGVSEIFALPGEENLPLVSALRRAGVSLVVCRHEQHAGYMAVAHARLTGSVSVCLVTLGPGAINAFTPLAQAHLIGVPLVVITGQKSLRENEEGPFQVLDIVGAASPITALATTITDPGLAAETTLDALRVAINRRDAVLLEIPEDVASAATPDRPAPRTISGTVRPDEASIVAAAEAINAAERPVCLAGDAANQSATAAALAHFADLTGISVIATQMGKGAIDEAHPRAQASLGMHRQDYSHLIFEEADLVVSVGYQPVGHPPQVWNSAGLPLIHVHREAAHVVAGYVPERELTGDISAVLDALGPLVTPVDTGWSDAVAAAVRGCLADERHEIEEYREDDGLLLGIDIVDAVQQHVTPEHCVALDNGLYKIWFARHFVATHPHSLVLDNATASMGGGLAVAMEAARVGFRAVAVVGDGGLLMNVGDLETARRLELDLTVVVVRDDAYGFIAWHQKEQGRERSGVDLTNPDLLRLAESFGGTGLRVDAEHSLVDLLREAEEARGVVVIDCPVAYHATEILELGDLLQTAKEALRRGS